MPVYSWRNFTNISATWVHDSVPNYSPELIETLETILLYHQKVIYQSVLKRQMHLKPFILRAMSILEKKGFGKLTFIKCRKKKSCKFVKFSTDLIRTNSNLKFLRDINLPYAFVINNYRTFDDFNLSPKSKILCTDKSKASKIQDLMWRINPKRPESNIL